MTVSLLEPLFRKLACFAELTDADKRVLESLVSTVKQIGPRQDIIQEGEKPSDAHLVLDGWAARYKLLPDGGRPIIGYLIPGDLCDIQSMLIDEVDHSITTLSPCTIAYLGHDEMAAMMRKSEPVSLALWWCILVSEAILREWLVTLGHRPADKRLAHFICEMFLRSKVVGLVDGDSFDLRLTQEEIGDTMGLSNVHVNRTLQYLRGEGLIISKGRRLTINGLDRLMQYADFNPNYLHVQRRAAPNGV